MLQEGVLRGQRVEAAALQGRGLRVLDSRLHGACVHRVELWLVQVGLGHALLEVVQDDVVRGAAEVAERLLVRKRGLNTLLI